MHLINPSRLGMMISKSAVDRLKDFSARMNTPQSSIIEAILLGVTVSELELIVDRGLVIMEKNAAQAIEDRRAIREALKGMSKKEILNLAANKAK